jgi:hypothetical protein
VSTPYQHPVAMYAPLETQLEEHLHFLPLTTSGATEQSAKLFGGLGEKSLNHLGS